MSALATLTFKMHGTLKIGLIMTINEYASLILVSWTVWKMGW
jgi:hypothetical protein